MFLVGHKYTCQVFSTSYHDHLSFSEPPRFIDCLGPVGKTIAINEGQSVNSTCSYYGNPRPELTCRVLDVNNAQVSPPFPITVSQNLTGTNRLLLSGVGKNAKFVSCTASHTATGSKETKRSLIVYCRVSCRNTRLGLTWVKFVVIFPVGKDTLTKGTTQRAARASRRLVT